MTTDRAEGLPVARGGKGTGLALLLLTTACWGLSWPVGKFVLSEWPPLSLRGITGVVGGLTLASYVIATRISLKVPADQWPRLLISSVLNVTVYMATMGIALSMMPASEVSVVAYTMPIWTAVLAWPLLGERLTALRLLALVLAFAGLTVLFGGNGISAAATKLPGILLAMTGALGFAVGTIFLKRHPIELPGATSAAWQIGIGSLPLALAGIFFEHPSIGALTGGGWAALVYLVLMQFCIAYVAWFAALKRLPASIAAIGTMLVPVISVVVSGIALHEPLGARHIGALVCTIVGVALAARS